MRLNAGFCSSSSCFTVFLHWVLKIERVFRGVRVGFRFFRNQRSCILPGLVACLLWWYMGHWGLGNRSLLVYCMEESVSRNHCGDRASRSGRSISTMLLYNCWNRKRLNAIGTNTWCIVLICFFLSRDGRVSTSVSASISVRNSARKNTYFPTGMALRFRRNMVSSFLV